MKIILGGFFPKYLKGAPRLLDLSLAEPIHLAQLLEKLGIPPAEVHMVVVNGELVEAGSAVLNPDDEVRLYPPADGG